MVKKEIFICDNCGRSSVDLSDSSDPPYVQGWRFLNDFEFKASKEFKHQIIRKHFCSTECMLRYIEGFTRSQEDELHSMSNKPIAQRANSNL